MTNFNKVFLMGRLTRDPELRYTQSGTPVCKFGLAVNHRYIQGNEQRESTTFVDLTAFGKNAETIAKSFGKGRPIFTEGRLEFSSWTAQDGGKRSKLAVVVETFRFIDNKQQEGEKTEPDTTEPDVAV